MRDSAWRWPACRRAGLTLGAAGLLAACTGDPRASSGHGALDPVDSTDAQAVYDHAVELDRQRNVGAASRFYRRVLELDPVQEPSAEDVEQAIRLAPRLFTVEGEPFVLEDVAAVLDPDGSRIGYHLFWDDDIDFPDDNEPTDHEVVWVTFDPSDGRAIRLQTYFHGEIVSAEVDPDVGRPEVFVEWGKHGSLPRAAVRADSVPDLLREHWRTLNEDGTRRQGHPLARGWPTEFGGGFAAYTRGEVEVDPAGLLRERRMVARSRWANAVIDQRFLRYNFSAKPAWP